MTEQRAHYNSVRLQERTRIAQELHDTLLQSFFAASMQLGVALDMLPSDSPVKPRLNGILQLVERGIEEGRNTIQGLRSCDSCTIDLAAALSSIQKELAVPPEVEFRVRVSGRQPSMLSAAKHEVYRIGREALVNAFCHSAARRIDLELEYGDTFLSVRVRDNGCGIDAQVLEAGRERHWGLTGMRERARRIGGLLRITSGVGVGTEVQLLVPTDIAFRFRFGEKEPVNPSCASRQRRTASSDAIAAE